MAESILQITYISSRSPNMVDSEVERILSSARLRNRGNQVTGLLLFNGHRFLQHLEGPADAVEETLDRIRVDGRHRGLVILSRKQAEFRAFSNWSMAFERVDSCLPERRQSLEAQVARMVEGVDPRIGQHFLGYARLRPNKAA